MYRIEERFDNEQTGKNTDRTICFSGKLHDAVLLDTENWMHHIIARHPEMTLELVSDILFEPDQVYKPSKNSKEFYYQKYHLSQEYRVVVTHCGKNKKAIATAYQITADKIYDHHTIYCCYSKLDDELLTVYKNWQDCFTMEYEQMLLSFGGNME